MGLLLLAGALLLVRGSSKSGKAVLATERQ